LLRTHIPRFRLLLVAALAVTAIGYGATSGSARTSVYSWPGAVMLHVHTTPDGSSPGYVQSDPYYVDCPDACDRPYDVGQTISLWAHPTHGFAFGSWTTGPCKDSTANPCTFTISADTDVTADFSGKFDPSTPPDSSKKTLHVIMDTSFCFICVKPSSSMLALARHTVRALSASCAPSLGVAGALGSSCCARPSLAKSVAGGCGPSYAIVYSTDGKIECFDDGWNVCSAEYPTGAQVTLVADACDEFLGWEDSATTDNPRTVTMDTDRTVIAAFIPDCY
jgi:hypothetical protein